jgi:hypothetical protein
MTSGSETKAQVARESDRRRTLAVPAFAGGLLYLLGGIISTATLNGIPSVGLLQGLQAALRGEANPAVSPRVGEVKFISHHAFPLIAGSLLTALALVTLALVLRFLFSAVRFRRPESWVAAGPLALVGGLGLAALNLAHEIVRAIETHAFATGHNFTRHAADRALLLAGTNSVVITIPVVLCSLMLAIGMIVTIYGGMRVGLLTRWHGILGIFSGVIFLPLFQSATLQLITSFWLVAMGILLMGRWPNGDPPAWAAGEARPWPSQAEAREARAKRAGAPALSPAGASGGSGAEVAPAPQRPAQASSSRRRRRKRGGRR